MIADRYKHRLKAAKWTYREGKQTKAGNEHFRKDRISSRADKRGARNEDAAEARTEAASIEPVMWDEVDHALCDPDCLGWDEWDRYLEGQDP